MYVVLMDEILPCFVKNLIEIWWQVSWWSNLCISIWCQSARFRSNSLNNWSVSSNRPSRVHSPLREKLLRKKYRCAIVLAKKSGLLKIIHWKEVNSTPSIFYTPKKCCRGRIFINTAINLIKIIMNSPIAWLVIRPQNMVMNGWMKNTSVSNFNWFRT